MTSKERVLASLNHKQPDKVAVDFGGTAVTGIHVMVIEGLRKHYGLAPKPVKVIEPYQMLGEVDDELKAVMGIDTVGISARNTMFGFPNDNWKEFKTFWGQTVLVSDKFITKIDEKGDLLIYPEGDTTAPPSGHMPNSSFFFDTISRNQPVMDDSTLKLEDNLEEFGLMKETDIKYWKDKMATVANTDRAVIGNIGGTGLGDIALVPGPFMKYPKGIRDITDWYMSTVMRSDYIKAIFEKQTDIAIQNLKTFKEISGTKVDVAFICGTDFGTQDSQFCSPDTFRDLYKPYYRKMNDWIHANTNWKTFKHSCGAVEPLIPEFIDAGFDIINPVQINAVGMDSQKLKDKYGNHITFWGGGVDTQKVLSFGTPKDVEKQVIEQCKILSKNGGFIFNTVHNTQANTPIDNLASMIKAIKTFNGEK